MEKIFLVLKGAAVIIGVLLIIGLGIKSSKGMPDYAEVYVNDSAKTYLAPLCIQQQLVLELSLPVRPAD